jgi:hypothetical protein
MGSKDVCDSGTHTYHMAIGWQCCDYSPRTEVYRKSDKQECDAHCDRKFKIDNLERVRVKLLSPMEQTLAPFMLPLQTI